MADGEIDDTAVVLGGELGERVETVVGIRRRDERLCGHATKCSVKCTVKRIVAYSVQIMTV
ncbi:MAG: hypothetical protein EB111_06495 [Actinobacteria bacterium]|nr:hypothetical protein [Actinomycetota bacterium]